MLKATQHLKDQAMKVIAEMQKNNLPEMDLPEPEGFLVTTLSAKEMGYMPIERITYQGKSYLLCHR